jgi:hypothetical protein
MPRVTCHRKNYKLLDPHVWEVFGGKYNTEHQGYYNGVTKTSCDPPRYLLITDDPENIDLPPGSVILEHERTYEDEFLLELQGPEVNEIRDTKEQTIYDLENTIQTLRNECGVMDIKIKKLEHELKHKKPSGSIRWKLTYTWCDNVTEVYWDFKTKKQAVTFMEDNIKGFFGTKLVESIRDVKYDKYIYGTRNVDKN